MLLADDSRVFPEALAFSSSVKLIARPSDGAKAEVIGSRKSTEEQL